MKQHTHLIPYKLCVNSGFTKLSRSNKPEGIKTASQAEFSVDAVQRKYRFT